MLYLEFSWNGWEQWFGRGCDITDMTPLSCQQSQPWNSADKTCRLWVYLFGKGLMLEILLLKKQDNFSLCCCWKGKIVLHSVNEYWQDQTVLQTLDSIKHWQTALAVQPLVVSMFLNFPPLDCNLLLLVLSMRLIMYCSWDSKKIDQLVSALGYS